MLVKNFFFSLTRNSIHQKVTLNNLTFTQKSFIIFLKCQKKFKEYLLEIVNINKTKPLPILKIMPQACITLIFFTWIHTTEHFQRIQLKKEHHFKINYKKENCISFLKCQHLTTLTYL